jgi:hypothetical protein
MMTKSILWMAVLLPAALAADKGKDNLHAWYRDGTCVEFYSESTGTTTPSSTSGSVIVDNTNTVHRVVTDGHGNILFTYDVVAHRAAGSKDSFVVQIRPGGGAVTGIARTVAAVRDFPAVKRGEAVKVDILQNPATGETIYDVLRPSDDPPPTTAAKIADELVLGSLQISINGEMFVQDFGGIVTGAVARIYVPKHGAYFLSLEAAPGFIEVGHANREKLTFSLGDEYVEIVAKQSVLTKSTYRPVWVKHDPAFVVTDAKTVEVMTADKVEWLIPKKR